MMKGSSQKKRAHAPARKESALSATLREQAWSALNSAGFFVARDVLDLSDVTAEVLEELKQLMRKRKDTDFIFNEHGLVAQDDAYPDECGDRLRLQLFFSKARLPPRIKWLLESIKARTEEIFPATHEACDHVLLLSEPGCANQQCHTDYDPETGDQDGLGCIIALEDETALNVWPGSIDFDVDAEYHRERLALRAGDMLLFRGDLVHSGASYEASNVRVHCFLDTYGATKRLDNKSYFMAKHANIKE